MNRLGGSVLYALLVSFWIFVSDWRLGVFIPAPQQVSRLATYQGPLFVTVTTLLVYGLVRREFRAHVVPVPQTHSEPVLTTSVATVMTTSAAMAPANVQLDTGTHQRLAESNRLQHLTAALLQQPTLDDLLPLVCREAQ